MLQAQMLTDFMAEGQLYDATPIATPHCNPPLYMFKEIVHIASIVGHGLLHAAAATDSNRDCGKRTAVGVSCVIVPVHQCGTIAYDRCFTGRGLCNPGFHHLN